jgi:hypothetical protein
MNNYHSTAYASADGECATTAVAIHKTSIREAYGTFSGAEYEINLQAAYAATAGVAVHQL